MFSLITFFSSVAVEVIYSRGIVTAVLTKTNTSISNLFNLATYHGITLAALALTLFFQMATESEVLDQHSIDKDK